MLLESRLDVLIHIQHRDSDTLHAYIASGFDDCLCESNAFLRRDNGIDTQYDSLDRKSEVNQLLERLNCCRPLGYIRLNDGAAVSGAGHMQQGFILMRKELRDKRTCEFLGNQNRAINVVDSVNPGEIQAGVALLCYTNLSHHQT